jgi:hypothetical protein
VLAAFFAFGILCSTFAAPGQSLASVTDCSQDSGGMAMTGCEHPTFLCGFDSSSNLAIPGISRLAFKNDLFVAAGGTPVWLAHYGAHWIGSKHDPLPARSKVSIHLFKSTLNL